MVVGYGFVGICACGPPTRLLYDLIYEYDRRFLMILKKEPLDLKEIDVEPSYDVINFLMLHGH